MVQSRDSAAQYFLKLLRPNRAAEVDVLAYLSNIDSPDNHTVRLVAFRTCDLGTLILLPYAGIPLCDYGDIPAHLVSIASQFLEGVAFLHEHKVAHCDLKTSNVVVDRDTGRITLIDFDLAARGIDWLGGFSGTEGWTAPKVGNAPRYNAMRADVWAAGKVLYTIAVACPESGDRQFLIPLSEGMMATDPNMRPSMMQVVEKFKRYVKGRAESVLPAA